MSPDDSAHARESGSDGGDRACWLALAALVALGLVLRWVGVGFLLPHDLFSDSLAVTQEVAQLRHEEGSPGRIYEGLYPGLLPRIGLLAPGRAQPPSEPLTLDEHLARAARPRRDLRIVFALVSILAVPATWVLARRFLGPRWALVAAAFIATSFFDTWYSPQERPHSVHAALALIAVVNLLDLRRRPSPRAFVFAGLSMGLAIGALQSGIAVLLPFAAAVFLSGEGKPAHVVRRNIIGVGLALGLAALAIPVFYPFLFEKASTIGSGLPGVAGTSLNLSGHKVRLDLLNGQGLVTVAWTMWSYEPLLSFLALAGALVGVWRRRMRPPLEAGLRRDLTVVLAYAIPYFVMISLYQRTGQRFCIPLLPYVALLATWLLREAARAMGAWTRVPLVRRTACVLLVGLPLGAESLCSAKLVAMRAAPDTIELAAAWIREHVEPDRDRILVSPRMDLPLLRSGRSLVRNAAVRHDPMFEWFAYRWRLPLSELAGGYDLETLGVADTAWVSGVQSDPRAFVRDQRCGYAVLEVREGWSWKLLQRLRTGIQEEGELVARFEPDDGAFSYSLPIEYQDDGLPRTVPWFWRIARAQRLGPVLEIYRLGAKDPTASPVR